jgi:hypothetical protein
MDSLNISIEENARDSARSLQIFLSTVAPVTYEDRTEAIKQINNIAGMFNWKTRYDKQLGYEVVKGKTDADD